MQKLPAESLQETSPRYPGWHVVAVCFVMALFCWGFGFYGHSVYLAELQRRHGWPAGLIAGASTIYYLFGALLVAFVGDAIARLGPRHFVLAGLGFMAASAALLPAITAPWQLYAVYLLMAFGWAALSLGAITNLIGLWFRERRGLAISLALNGASCGGIVVAPMLVLLIEHTGFATAMLIATGVMLVVLGPLVLAWMDRPPSLQAMRSDDHNNGHPAPIIAPHWTKREALRSLRFWTASAPFALALAAQVGFLVHQIAFLSPVIGRSGAALAVAVTTTMAVIGRVGLGTIIDRLNQRLTSAVSFSSQAAALFLMTQTGDPTMLLAACAVYGFSVGNLITFPALIIQREFDPASFGMLISLSTAIGQFTYAFGPGLLGLVRDLTGDYTAALFVCIGLNLAATAIILMRPKDEAQPGPA